jgi:hypothetical protein
MTERPGDQYRRNPCRWPAAIAAARQAAAAYRANREDLESVVRLIADALALAALVRRHNRAAPVAVRAGEAAAP